MILFDSEKSVSTHHKKATMKITLIPEILYLYLIDLIEHRVV